MQKKLSKYWNSNMNFVVKIRRRPRKKEKQNKSEKNQNKKRYMQRRISKGFNLLTPKEKSLRKGKSRRINRKIHFHDRRSHAKSR